MFPPAIGGSAIHAATLSRLQGQQGHRVIVLTTLEGDFKTSEVRDGYTICRFAAVASPLQNPIPVSMYLPIRRILKWCDIINAHSHLMFATSIACLANSSRKRPLVVTNHGYSVRRGRLFNLAMKSYLQSVGDRILKQADHVISFTERENQLVLNHGIPRSKTSVIPTGVDTKLFTQRRESSTTPTVLWVGRFVPEKGLNTLLNAAKLVTTKMPHVKFVLIGYGPLYGWLLDLRTKLRLEKSVEFVQPVPHERLVDYLSRATVFALPSLNEGLPSTILEAMSCSRPVVVTKGIGLDDVVKDAGALFPLGDSDQLAETLLDIINDGSKSRLLGAAARKRALQFDWSSISRQTSELFESIIEAYHR